MMQQSQSFVYTFKLFAIVAAYTSTFMNIYNNCRTKIQPIRRTVNYLFELVLKNYNNDFEISLAS